MSEKMTRFLRSIGINDVEAFDLEFASVSVNPYKKEQIDMAIRKDSPWDYSSLSYFQDALSRIRYPYSLRFCYGCELSLSDAISLFNDWHLNLLHGLPSFSLGEEAKTMTLSFESEEEKEKLHGDEIARDFKDLLSWLNYPFDVEARVNKKEEAPAAIYEEQIEATTSPSPIEEKEIEAEIAKEESFPETHEEVMELIEEEQKEYQRLSEEELLKEMIENEKKMMEEREKARVFSIGNYKFASQIKMIESLGKVNVDFNGEIFDYDSMTTRKGSFMATFGVGDMTSAISVRAFESKRLPAGKLKILKAKQRVRIRGAIDADKRNGSLCVMAHFIDLLPPRLPEKDDEPVQRVELHLHTNMSTMDGIAPFEDYYDAARAMGMEAIALTDHGCVQSFPGAQDARDKHIEEIKTKGLDEKPLKIIYGCELYMFDRKPNYVLRPKGVSLKEARYVVFDTETTGLSARYDRIVEFGGVLVEKGRIIKSFDSFIRPEPEIDLSAPGVVEALAVNRIPVEEIKKARPIEEVLPEILEFLGDNILVAHNATFDIGFLNATLERLGKPKLTNTVIDTLPLSHYLFPFAGRHNEGAMLRNLGLNVYDESRAHRADYDAQCLNDGWQEIILRLEESHPNILDSDLLTLELLPGDKAKDDLETFKKKNQAFNAFCRHIADYHVTVLAKNMEGVKDLYRIITEGHLTYLASPSHPKTPRDLLEKYRSNLLVGSACFNGEIFEIAQTRNKDELAEAMAFYDYIEIQPIENYSYLLNMGRIHSKEHLLSILNDIIEAAKIAGKKVVATGDVHYVYKEDKICRDVYIAARAIGGGMHPLNPPSRKNKPLFDNPDQHLRGTKEMLDSFLTWMDEKQAREIVIDNSRFIASQIEDGLVLVTNKPKPPDHNLPNSAEKIRTLCESNFEKIYGGNRDPLVQKRIKEVHDRLERELDGIIGNGYAVTYYIAHLLIKEAGNEPEHFIVGSRGSVGSSFAATMAEITEVNPLPPHYLCPHCHYMEWGDSKYKSGFDLPDKNCPQCGHKMKANGQNIPFETFLGFHADKVPDIDLNFEEESQHRAHDYTKKFLGEDNVYRAGTIETVAEKTAFGFVRGYFEDFLKVNPDTVNPNYIAYLAARCQGVKRTTGQHPGGIVVVPSDLSVYDFTAIQYPADDLSSSWKTTHYDFASMHDEILKLDILGHVDPMAMRYYRDLTGLKIEDIPMNDPKVLSLFVSPKELRLHRNFLNQETGALALPEFGTDLGQRMLHQAKPTCFNDLLIMSGLAHGTDVWSGNAEDLISRGVTDLNGVIGCRDDIMTYLIKEGIEPSVAFKIMEGVRKGKGLSEEQEATMRAHKIPDFYINSAKKIKYLFPRGHATAYVMMAVRVAYFKLYYPLEFYAVFFSIRSDDWDIKAMVAGEEAIISRINALRERNADPSKANPLSNKEANILRTLLVAIEMVERGYKFAPMDLYKSDAKMFVVDRENKALIPPFSVIDGLGLSAAESLVEARYEKDKEGKLVLGSDGKPKIKKFISKEDVMKRAAKINQTNLKDLEELGVLDGLGDTNQMSLFDFM